MVRFCQLAIGIFILFLSSAASADPDSVLGLWLVDDKDGIIEIHACDTGLCGRIAWMQEPLRKDGSIKRDAKNPDETLRSRPLCGLDVLTHFEPAGPDSWENGRAYSPDSGSTYHAEMRLGSDGTLRLRGYIAVPLLGETRTWTRAPANAPRCSAS